jgi:hypothetical protein
MDIRRSGAFVNVLILLIGTLIVDSSPANSEPYLAVRTGFKCGQCHVNRTGGGKRTDFGLLYSQTNLDMKIIRSARKRGFFDGRLSEFISVGANLRSDNVSLFAFTNAKGDKTDYSNNSRISEANLYFQFDLIPDVLTLYADQTLEPSANRELFGLLENLPFNSYLKVGRTLLPYGFRLLDDDAFIRNVTGYTYNRHDVSLEIGFEPGPYSLIANATDNQLSIIGTTVFRRFRVGGSYGRNIKRGGEFVYGALIGVNFGRFTLLGEGDFVTNGDLDQFVGMAELNFLIRSGFNFKTVYEFFDRNRDISNDRDGQERITFGVEPFLTRFMQVGLFYRINRFIPQNVFENRDQLTAQFHVFF